MSDDTPQNGQPLPEAATPVPVAPPTSEMPAVEVTLTPGVSTPTAPANGEFDLSEPEEASEGTPLQTQWRQNFKQTDAFSTEGMAGFDPTRENLVMPSGSRDRTLETLTHLVVGIDHERNPEAAAYVNTVGLGMRATPIEGGFQSTANRPDAQFVQRVPTEVGDLAGFTPNLKPRATHTPQTARTLIRSRLKLGTVFRVPLWHSGFWVTIQAPSEGELIELQRAIASEKVVIGRQTYGMLFSNTLVYSTAHLVNFIQEHIIESSFQLPEGETYAQYLRLPDLQLLVWGLACAVYPTGFQYSRPCSVEPDKCRHVLQEKLNVGRLLWTDLTKLSAEQLAHMGKRGKAETTPQAVLDYQGKFLVGQARQVSLADGIKVELRNCTVQQHIEAGYRWISMLEETYGRAMTYDEVQRKDFIGRQAKASIMREYAHFVKNVQIDEDTIFDDPEIVETTLNDLTADDNVREAFQTAVQKFIDDAQVALIAIPSHECPACKRLQLPQQEGNPYPELIPLDAATTFFDLVTQRNDRIQQRELRVAIQ